MLTGLRLIRAGCLVGRVRALFKNRHIGDMLEIVVYLWVPQFRVLGKPVARWTGFFALWPRSAKRNEHHHNVLLRPISHSDAVDYRSSSNTKGAVQHDMNKTSFTFIYRQCP